jgi:ribonuclease HII
MQTADLFPTAGGRPLELQLRRTGHRAVAGVDEVGRGCLAGPVVAAAVVLKNYDAKFIADIDDSKQVAPRERERLDKLIRKWAVAVAVAEVSHEDIDRINILQASFKAMRIALEALPVQADFVLVDGHLKIPGIALAQRPVVKGDALCKSIGAASIVAKVYRDRLMTEWHATYPQYGFRDNKGYGTPEHLKALHAFGPTPLHRLSFEGVASAGAVRPAPQLALEGTA